MKYFFTSDDFEEESLQKYAQVFPEFTSFLVNGKSILSSLPTIKTSSSGLSKYDIDIQLIPSNDQQPRQYK